MKKKEFARPFLIAFFFLFSALPVEAAPFLTLDKAIERALLVHPDAAVSEAQLRNSVLDVSEAKSQRVQLTGDLSTSERYAQAASTPVSDRLVSNATLGLTIPLYTGFRLQKGVLAAEKGEEEARAQLAVTRADIASQTAALFWGLYLQEGREAIQGAAIQQAARTLELTRTGFRLGRFASNEVDRAEVNWLNAQSELLGLQTQTRQARAKLATQLALPGEGLAIDGKASMIFLPFLTEKEAPAVRAARAHLASAQAQLGAAQGELLPQLSLASSYQYGNNPFDPALGARGLNASFSGNWDLRLSLSYNFLDGGKLSRKVQRSQEDLRIAEARREKAGRDALSGIEQARIRLNGANDRMLFTEKGSALAERTLKWVETRFRQGYSLQVEVNDARTSWLIAKNQQLQALVDYQIARADLAKALGLL
ncbi:MAG TPA: TolC family protein [Chroococcales cyanobacterium]|jgi:outer membrane protein TolC